MVALVDPNDAAFEKVPAGTLASLLADPYGALTDVLKYHVVSGKVLSSELYDGQMISTLSGKSLLMFEYESIDEEIDGLEWQGCGDDGESNLSYHHVVFGLLYPLKQHEGSVGP